MKTINIGGKQFELVSNLSDKVVILKPQPNQQENNLVPDSVKGTGYFTPMDIARRR